MKFATNRTFSSALACSLLLGSLLSSATAETTKYNATDASATFPTALQNTATNQYVSSVITLTSGKSFNVINFTADSAKAYTYDFYGMRISELHVANVENQDRDYKLTAYSRAKYGRTIVFAAQDDKDVMLDINENFSVALSAAGDSEVRRTLRLESDVLASIATAKTLRIEGQFIGDKTFTVYGGGTMSYENISLNSTAPTCHDWVITGDSTLNVSSDEVVTQGSLAGTLGSGTVTLNKGTLLIANGDTLSNDLILTRKGTKKISTSTPDGSLTLDNKIVFTHDNNKINALNLDGSDLVLGKNLTLNLSCLNGKEWNAGDTLTLIENIGSITGNIADINITGTESIAITLSINEDGAITATPKTIAPPILSPLALVVIACFILLAILGFMIIRYSKDS